MHTAASVASIKLSSINALFKDNKMAKQPKHEEIDAETQAIIDWCIQVEELAVTRGATQAQAQQFIEDEIEWLTDLFYDGLTPEEAVKEVMN